MSETISPGTKLRKVSSMAPRQVILKIKLGSKTKNKMKLGSKTSDIQDSSSWIKLGSKTSSRVKHTSMQCFISTSLVNFCLSGVSHYNEDVYLASMIFDPTTTHSDLMHDIY